MLWFLFYLFFYIKELDQQATIHTKGCVPQFEKWLQDNLTIVAGVFIGIALLQVSDLDCKNCNRRGKQTWNLLC